MRKLILVVVVATFTGLASCQNQEQIAPQGQNLEKSTTDSLVIKLDDDGEIIPPAIPTGTGRPK